MLHVYIGAVVTGFIVLLSVTARVALGNAEAAVVPAHRLSVKGIFEVLVEYINSLVGSVMGDHGHEFVPLFASVFFFILFNNFIGLLPGMSAATSNMNTALAVAIFIFVTYNFLGIKENGFGYLKHFMGPMWVLAPLMFPLEIVSHLVRPFSLGLRLSGNMTGDHTVLAIFTELVPVGVPVIFYGLGAFVCLVQAFVFTLLSMIYIAMATSHEH